MAGQDYRPVSAWGKAIYGDDDVELELSAAEERDLVTAGHLEILPRRYRRLSDNYDGAGVDQGEIFEAAMPMENADVLVAGGHIERVRRAPEPEPDPKPAPAKKAAASKRTRSARSEG